MNAVHYASVWSVNSSAQKNILAVDTKIDLDSHAKTCEGGQQFSVIHDHSRPVIVIGYDPKQDQSMVAYLVSLLLIINLRQFKHLFY